jgi:hypothetical protein
MASSLIWLFVAGYGLRFSALRPLTQPRLVLAAAVEQSQAWQLPTGEWAHRSTALFTYEGAVYRAVGYGTPSSPLKNGQAVSVLMPRNAPEHAWIQGLQKFPLRLSGLAAIAAVALLPGALLSLWGLLAGAQQVKLVRHGVAVIAKRDRHWGLPRPLADSYLDRYALVDAAGKARSVWSLGPDGQAQAQILLAPSGARGAAVVDRLLPNLCYRHDQVQGTSRWRQAGAWGALLLWLGQFGTLALYLAT